MRYKATRLENNNGKLWHIGCDETDVAKHMILPADPARCEMIAKYFDEAELRTISRGNPTYRGKKNGVDVGVSCTGMGGAAVAICAEEYIQCGAKTLIRMGTAGSLQKNIPNGSFVICTGAVRGDGTTPEYINMQYPAVADVDVVHALRQACEEFGVKPFLGIVRSHDAFYLESPGAHEGWEERVKLWTDAGCVAVENESSTLFVVSSLLGGVRAGTILLTGNNLYDGYGKMATANDTEYPKRVEMMTKITLRAIEILDELPDLEDVRVW